MRPEAKVRGKRNSTHKFSFLFAHVQTSYEYPPLCIPDLVLYNPNREIGERMEEEILLNVERETDEQALVELLWFVQYSDTVFCSSSETGKWLQSFFEVLESGMSKLIGTSRRTRPTAAADSPDPRSRCA